MYFRKVQYQSSFPNTGDGICLRIGLQKRLEEQKQMMLKGVTPYQVIERENSPCPLLSDVVDSTQTKKIKSCCYLPGMPE